MGYPGLQIESTTSCNGKCSFCPVGEPGLKRPRGEMSDELFMKIIGEADELGITTVLIFLNGEPFCFPRFFDWMQILREHGKETAIFTNAAVMTPERADQLLDFSDITTHVFFSCSGKDEESAKRIQGLRFQRQYENVKYFMERNNGRYDPRVTMPAIETPQYRAEWQRVWGSICKTQINPLFNWGGTKAQGTMNGQPHPCPRIFSQMCILWDGRVPLCCQDGEGDVILGDLNTQSIAEVYDSHLYRHYRQCHNDGRFSEMELCRDCNMNR